LVTNSFFFSRVFLECNLVGGKTNRISSNPKEWRKEIPATRITLSTFSLPGRAGDAVKEQSKNPVGQIVLEKRAVGK